MYGKPPRSEYHLADGAIPIRELCRRHVRLRLHLSLACNNIVGKRPKGQKLWHLACEVSIRVKKKLQQLTQLQIVSYFEALALGRSMCPYSNRRHGTWSTAGLCRGDTAPVPTAAHWRLTSCRVSSFKETSKNQSSCNLLTGERGRPWLTPSNPRPH